LFSILLSNKKVNQICFTKFLFHLLEVAVSIDFAREKKMFFTGFTHCKVGLWKSCELDLWRKLPVNCFCIGEGRLKIGFISTEKQVLFVFRKACIFNQTTLLV